MFIDVGTDTLIKIFEATSSDEVIVHTQVLNLLLSTLMKVFVE